MRRLENKTALITGAASGIGAAAASLFAKHGARVILLDINAESGQRLADEIMSSGGQAEFIRTDVADADDVAQAFARIGQTYGSLDILYNNASIFLGKEDNILSELEDEVLHKIIAVNLFSLFYCSKHAIRLMLKNKGGAIINTSSSAGLIGIPKCDAYTASKGATIALTKSMAVEYGPSNIRVNCIAPAAIATDMVIESNLSDPDFDEQHFLTQGTPLRRWGQPGEIAQLALFLASDDSSYLNGAIIVADGGITIT